MKGGKFSKVTIVKKEWRGTTKKKKKKIDNCSKGSGENKGKEA